jgi:acyl-CoA dehydrogenase
MIPRKIFAEEHEIFRNSVRRFFDAEVAPHYDTWEEEGMAPRALGEAGLQK